MCSVLRLQSLIRGLAHISKTFTKDGFVHSWHHCSQEVESALTKAKEDVSELTEARAALERKACPLTNWPLASACNSSVIDCSTTHVMSCSSYCR